MLQQNIRNFPLGGSHRIRDGLLVQGFDTKLNDRAKVEAYDLAMRSLAQVVEGSGIRLRRIDTNLRQLDTSPELWIKQFVGPALAAAAHAAIQSNGVARVAAGADIPHLAPGGSHPLIDPILGTERVSIVHVGCEFSRLAKVRDLADWPVALANLRVCTNIIPGFLNCGTCEKCIRTKLAIAAVGADIPQSFANRSLDPRLLRPVTTRYQAACYREMVTPLRQRGMGKLALHVLWNPLSSSPRLRSRRWTAAGRAVLKAADEALTNAWLKRAYATLKRRRMVRRGSISGL